MSCFFYLLQYFDGFCKKTIKTIKQLKQDYSENIWRDENRGHMSVKKQITVFLSAGAHKVGVITFCPTFDPHFSNIRTLWKGKL